MSAQADRSHTAQIVDLVRLLDASGRKRDVSLDESGSSAILLSIRQKLRYQASVGLDDIDSLKLSCPKPELDCLLNQVRQLLNSEFGRLRVHRYRQAFSVGHHSLEGLIAGLLRVQYYARQLQLPESASGERQARILQSSLGWGVADTLLEADIERVRRRRSGR